MDPEITAAIIGGVTTITASTIAYISTKRARDQKSAYEELEQAINLSTKKGHEQSAPFSFKQMNSTLRLNDSGEAMQLDEWIELKPNQRFENLVIPSETSIDGRDSKFLEISSGPCDESALPIALEHSITSSDEAEPTHKLTGKFKLIGFCDESTTPLSFYLKLKTENSYRMTEASTVAAYGKSDWQTEYYAVSIYYPTNQISIKIILPEHFNANNTRPSLVVFINGTHVVNRQETQRVKPKLSTKDNKLSAFIDNPLAGMAYAITWMPPA
mgnify:CR=1 FL=1